MTDRFVLDQSLSKKPHTERGGPRPGTPQPGTSQPGTPQPGTPQPGTLRACLEEVFLAEASGLRGRIRSILRNHEGVEDVLQETFFRAWTTRASWDGRGPVEAWLGRIAVNLAHNYRRTVVRRREAPLVSVTDEDDDAEGLPVRQLESQVPGPEAQLAREELRLLVSDLLDRLPEGKLEAVRLVYLEELSVDEAARALGVPRGTVKSRLHYGRRAIGDALDRNDGE